MRLSEQERSAAQADLDRLTGELVRLHRLREQLKLALSDGEADPRASGVGEATTSVADPPLFRVLRGELKVDPQRDPAQRQALRDQFQIILGGLS